MAWPTLVPPTPGTVITAAWESAMVNNPLLWLRAMTGNADPPANDYVVVSQGTASTAWGKVTANVLGPGAVVGHLGYTPASRDGDTFTGAVTVPWYFTLAKLDDAGNGGRLLMQPSSGQAGAWIDVTNGVWRVFNTLDPSKMLALNLVSGNVGMPAALSLGALDASTTGRLVGTTPASAAGYTIDAVNNVFRIFNSADASRQLAFSLTTGDFQVPSTLRLTALGPVTSGRIVGVTPSGAAGYTIDTNGNVFRIYNTADPSKVLAFGLTTGGLDAGGFAVITAQTIGAQSVAFATNAGNASTVGGLTPTATPGPGQIPRADASGKLDAWVTPASFSIPSGLGFWVRNAADIPTGFSRDTTLDGLIPIGAGTSFGQTFAEATSYGSTWQHNHSVPSLSVSVTSVTVSGSATGGPSDVTGNNSAAGQSAGTGTSRADNPHNHSLNGVSLAVSASGTGAGATGTGTAGNTTWLPPMRGVVYCRKD